MSEDETWSDTGKTWADLKVVKVYAPCIEEWMDENKVTCTDIEEDFQGRDVVKFECPLCKETHTSLRRG